MKKQKTKTVRTKIALARILEISRPSLDRYLSLPGAPQSERGKGYDLEAVVSFIGANAESEMTHAKASDEIRSLKAREIGLRCDRMRFRLDVEKGAWVKKADVAAAIAQIMGPARNILDQKLTNEWPTAVAGLEPAQARIYGRRLADQICEAMQDLAKEFETIEKE